MSATRPGEPVSARTADEHVDIRSPKGFEQTVRDLTVRYEVECRESAGRRNPHEVSLLHRGRVLHLADRPTRTACLMIGTPSGAREAIGAASPDAALHLPARILVFEDEEGAVHVSYERLGPAVGRRGKPSLDAMAAVTDALLARLAAAAVAETGPAPTAP